MCWPLSFLPSLTNTNLDSTEVPYYCQQNVSCPLKSMSQAFISSWHYHLFPKIFISQLVALIKGNTNLNFCFYSLMMRRQRSSNRNLDVVHSGLILWQQPVEAGKPLQRERMARLLLTKDQLSVQVQASDDAFGSLAIISPADSASVAELSLRTVNVAKGPDGLGLSIKGGSDGTHHVPIVISKVLPGLSAAQTGQVFVGDLIVEVNGISLEGKPHEDVVQLLRDSAGPHVTLTLKRDTTVSPLLRRTQSSKRSLPSLGPDIAVFKSALKTPILGGVKEIASGVEDRALENIEDGPEQWKTVCRIALPLAFVCRYLWATDKMRSNAFEVRSVDSRSSGIIHCEDRKALEQWVQQIDAHIHNLNRKTIRMSNKYLHAADRISYISWIEERLPEGQPTEDPRQKWERRFLIFKGGDVCLFELPPLNADELDRCISLYKIYETALRTAIKRVDRREHIFILATIKGPQHFCSFQSRDQLHQFEVAYYNCLYKAVNAMQTRTFACSYDGRPAGLVIDLRLGFSLYDIPTKSYIWQYGFSELESSSDDGKMRVQFIFRNDAVAHAIGVRQLDVKDIECDEPLALVYTMHAFYVTKAMGADPEFLQNLPLS